MGHVKKWNRSCVEGDWSNDVRGQGEKELDREQKGAFNVLMVLLYFREKWTI